MAQRGFSPDGVKETVDHLVTDANPCMGMHGPSLDSETCRKMTFSRGNSHLHCAAQKYWECGLFFSLKREKVNRTKLVLIWFFKI